MPLYLVIAAGVVARATDQRADEAGRRRQEPPDPWPRCAPLGPRRVLVLYALQASYSKDVPNAIENVGFFLAPFAVLFALLLDVEWSGRLLGRVLIVVVAVAAVICAVIAIYQYLARDLFLNPELFDANELHVYFRANSLFFDPNILGRHLALAIDRARRLHRLGPIAPRSRARGARRRALPRGPGLQLLDHRASPPCSPGSG